MQCDMKERIIRKQEVVTKRVEEEYGVHSTIEGTGALWRGYSRQDVPVRAGVVYEGGDSVICGV